MKKHIKTYKNIRKYTNKHIKLYKNIYKLNTTAEPTAVGRLRLPSKRKACCSCRSRLSLHGSRGEHTRQAGCQSCCVGEADTSAGRHRVWCFFHVFVYVQMFLYIFLYFCMVLYCFLCFYMCLYVLVYFNMFAACCSIYFYIFHIYHLNMFVVLYMSFKYVSISRH